MDAALPKIDIVVARYGEDLASWLPALKLDPTRRVCVYDKSGSAEDVAGLRALLDGLAAAHGCQTRLVELPNLGRESHTYLTHIVEHHDLLAADPAAVVVFLQGSLADHLEPYGAPDPQTLVEMLVQDARLNGCSKSFARPTAGADPGYKIATHNGRPVEAPDALTFGQWVERHVCPELPPGLHWWSGALFGAQGEALTRRPRAAWRALLDLVSASRDPECGHFMERAWTLAVDAAPVDYAVVPFSGMPLPAAIAPATGEHLLHLRAGILQATLENVCRLARKKVYVGVCCQEDYDLVIKAFTSRNPFVMPLRTPDLPDPATNPILFCSCVQQQPFLGDDVILYVTCGQVLGGADLGAHARRLAAAPTGAYLSPHRCVPPDDAKKAGHASLAVAGRAYALPNTSREPAEQLPAPPDADAAAYSEAQGVVEAYSGALIMPFRTFRAVLFTSHHDMPQESACFSPFYHYGFRCWKTRAASQLFTVQLLAEDALSAPMEHRSLVTY